MGDALHIPRLVVAAASSGSGKTTVSAALARALRARGLRVAPFKCGPDYLDPSYHARAAGAPSHNLDGWMMGREAVLGTFARAAAGADVAIVEGMMGLFDGASADGEEGSTAEVARWLAAPALLCVDASGMARSVAALVRGFTGFAPGVEVAGVVCNRVGGRPHLDLLRRAVAWPPVVGGLPEDRALAFPERHLGLLAATAATDPLLDRWGELAATWLDLDRILTIARGAPDLPAPAPPQPAAPRRCRIGVARDEAFHFYYEDNLYRLASLGAELVPFSPCRDPRLPEVHGLYLGGGYPEAHVEALAANAHLRRGIARFAEGGGPIYAECGGFMYLCAAIRTLDGRRHAMAGLFPAEAVMHDRLQALGYVEAETAAASPLGPAGQRARGHEFRHSALAGAAEDAAPTWLVRRRPGEPAALEGFHRGSALGSYVHVHWASNPHLAEGFVASCAARARRQP